MTPEDTFTYSDLIFKYIERGQKIEAIKYVRKKTGLGLKEAKELTDRIESGQQFPDSVFKSDAQDTKNSAPKKPVSVEAKVIKAATKLMAQGKKLQAVKLIKEKTTLSLKQAKMLAEHLFKDSMLDKDGFETEDNRFETQDNSYQKEKKRISEEQQDLRDDELISEKNSRDLVFGKTARRDKLKHRRRNNSGCMLTLLVLASLFVSINFFIFFLFY